MASIDVQMTGPVKGRAVVLLHGFPFHRGIWAAQAESLARAGFRVVNVDLPGYGESRHRGPWTMASAAAEILQALDASKIEAFVAVGFSMGGYVALELAAQAPKRLEGLVLVATRAEADTPEGKANRSRLAGEIQKLGIGPLEQAMLPRLISPAGRRSNPEAVRRTRTYFAEANIEATVHALSALAERKDLRSILPAVKAPTLVLCGADDETMGTEPSKLLAKEIPGAKLEVAKDCGHMVMFERGPELTRALLSFLRSMA